MQLQIPPSIGGYTVERKLSQGGMGAILLGTRKSAGGFEKRVAIKVVLPQFGANEDYRTLFFDEAKLVARMNHPHLCQVFDFGEDHDVLYLVMEYVDGLSVERIQQLCREHRLRIPPALSTLIVAHAARGLHHAHALTDDQGQRLHVVHRDVSPQNLIVTETGSTKLIDFGIAKHTARQNQTQIGVVRGKPGYMAPEQARGEDLDARTDIFQLGIVLYELLAQRPLFMRDNVYESIRLAVEMAVPPVAGEFDDIDPALDDILAGALAKDPAHRFKNADAMARALDSVLARYAGKTGEGALGDFVRSLRAADDKAPHATASLPTRADPRPPGAHTAVLADTGSAVAGTAALKPPRQTMVLASDETADTALFAAGAPTDTFDGTAAAAPAAATKVFGTQDVEDLAFGERRRGPVAAVLALVVAGLMGLGLWASGVFDAAADDEPVPPVAHVAEPPAADPPAPPVGAGPDAGDAEDAGRVVSDDEPARGGGTTHAPKRRRPAKSKPRTASRDDAPAGGPPATGAPDDTREAVRDASAVPQVVKKDETYGRLSVAATDNFRVLVDKRDIGGTPLFNHRLATGAHTVELVLPNGAVSETRRVTIVEGRTTRIKAKQ